MRRALSADCRGARPDTECPPRPLDLDVENADLVDADGTLDGTYVSFGGIESNGQVLGWVQQSGTRNDEEWEAVARFNLAVVAAP